MAGSKKGKGKGKAKDAKAKAQAKSKKKAQRQAAPTRPKQKREQFKASKKGHKEEADRQIKLARDAPNNLTTQPEICAFITDETNKLGQKPLFIGVGDHRKDELWLLLEGLPSTFSRSCGRIDILLLSPLLGLFWP